MFSTRLLRNSQRMKLLVATGFGLILVAAPGCSKATKKDPEPSVSEPRQLSLTGHGDEVNAVTFSPDGQFVASGGRDGSVRLWDSQNGELRQTLTPGSGLTPLMAVAFSPDGTIFAAGTNSRTFQSTFGIIQLWDARTWEKKEAIQPGAGVNSIAFSPDSKLLAGGSDDGNVRFWDTSTKEIKKTLEGKSGKISFVTFSPDGALLVIGGQGNKLMVPESGLLHFAGALTVWDVQTGQLKQTLTSDQIPGSRVAFSPDSKMVATAGGDDLIRLWDAQTWKVTKSLPGHQGLVNSIAISPGGKTLASVGEDGIVRLWDIQTGVVKWSLTGHQGALYSLAFAPDGQTVASAGRDKTVRLWLFK